MTEHLAEPLVAPAPIPPVRVEIDVTVAPETAFRAFTTDFDRWWPRTHHIAAVEMAEAVLEPRPGGRWYERGTDGSECEWGEVLEWDPPRRLVLSWNIDGTYTYRAGLEHASRVTVSFTPLDAGGTRVELVHDEFERHADGATLRVGVGSPDGGWGAMLPRFAETAEAA